MLKEFHLVNKHGLVLAKVFSRNKREALALVSEDFRKQTYHIDEVLG